ncbi:hypothetical protein CUMW_123670 [Citrus unshiu]|nr:hypothetical protein CUMW_123670 [Citrus unshiu]
MPSSSLETDQNAGDLSSKTRGQTRFRRRRFHRSLGTLLVGFYSSRHQHHFPTNLLRSAAGNARGRSRPPPLDSPRSELSDLSFPSPSDEFRRIRKTRINPRTLSTPSLDIVTEICRYSVTNDNQCILMGDMWYVDLRSRLWRMEEY